MSPQPVSRPRQVLVVLNVNRNLQQEELDALVLEQEMLEALLEQQQLELELSHMENTALIEDPDPVEEARSLVNRTVPASSACTWMVDNVNMDNLETLPYDPGMANAMVEVDKDP
eukprot:s396_g25.t1